MRESTDSTCGTLSASPLIFLFLEAAEGASDDKSGNDGGSSPHGVRDDLDILPATLFEIIFLGRTICGAD